MSSPEGAERTDDVSFAARHAPYELLERRGFAAHPCAARQLQLRQTGSGGDAAKKGMQPSLASADEIRRRQAEAARLSDGGKQLGKAVAVQLVGQRVLVPTAVFGDESSNLVFDGKVRRRTRGRAASVDITFQVDGKTNSFDAMQALSKGRLVQVNLLGVSELKLLMQALQWVDLGADIDELSAGGAPWRSTPAHAAPPLPAAIAVPKLRGRKKWLKTPQHDKWFAQ